MGITDWDCSGAPLVATSIKEEIKRLIVSSLVDIVTPQRNVSNKELKVI